jgi:hypothetical protein
MRLHREGAAGVVGELAQADLVVDQHRFAVERQLEVLAAVRLLEDDRDSRRT